MTTSPAVPQPAHYSARLARNIRRNLAATNDLGFVGLLANAAAFLGAAPVFLVLKLLKALIETATFGVVTLSVISAENFPTGYRPPVRGSHDQ